MALVITSEKPMTHCAAFLYRSYHITVRCRDLLDVLETGVFSYLPALPQSNEAWFWSALCNCRLYDLSAFPSLILLALVVVFQVPVILFAFGILLWLKHRFSSPVQDLQVSLRAPFPMSSPVFYHAMYLSKSLMFQCVQLTLQLLPWVI